MMLLPRLGLVLAMLLAVAGCPSSDDDDSGEGEGEGEGEVCDPRRCEGECCETDTGTACVITTNNFNHCGECGNQCDLLAASLCAAGGCECGEEGAACDGTEESTCCARVGCVNTLTDAETCGNCNTSCIAPGIPEKQSDRCLDGGCVCGDAGEACDGNLPSTCCPDEGGGSSCHDILNEPENCGGCSLADRDEDEVLGYVRGDGILDEHHRCDAEVANMCRLAACVCGVPEDIGVEPAACAGGRASTCCAPANPADADLAVCANLDSDELHCGQCNNPCAKGENCTGGACG